MLLIVFSGLVIVWSNCWCVECQVFFCFLFVYGFLFMFLIFDYGFVFFVFVCLFGFFMVWGVGVNDVVNVMGILVGLWVLIICQVILVVMVFEFCGVYFVGGEVIEMIRSGIVDLQYMIFDLLVFGMFLVLLVVGVWLLLVMIKGWLVLIIYFIVGVIIGFVLVGVLVYVVYWGVIGLIVVSWVVMLVLFGLFVFVLFRSVQWLVLYVEDLFCSVCCYVLLYMFLVGFMVVLMIVGKGLKYVGLEFFGIQMLGLVLFVGGLVMGLGIVLLLCI